MLQIKDLFWNPIKWLQSKSLDELKKKLINKLYKEVYHDNIDKNTYREVYYSLEYNDIEQINKVLEYEIWVKIYLS